MARWSSSGQPGWGQAERTVSVRSLVASLVIVLIVGSMAGYVVRGKSNSTGATKLDSKAFRNSDVIDPSTSAISAADETSAGAVRAVTSFITGLPQVALQTPQQESAVLDQIVAPTADPTVRAELQNTIDTARDTLVGTGSFQKALTTKLVIAPASYRVDMVNTDRARVQVWFIGVVVDSSVQSSVSEWNTNDIQVQWTDHWRILTYSATSGPTPQPVAEDQQASTYNQVVGVFKRFQGLSICDGGELVVAGIHPNIFATFSLFPLLAGAVQSAVKTVLNWSLYIIAHSPEPDLTAIWYRTEYHLMLTIGGYVTVAVALAATITAVLKGGLKEVLRTYLVGIPIAIFGGVFSIAFVTLMQKVDQDMTAAMLSHTSQYFDAFFASIAAKNNSTGDSLATAGSAILELILFSLILIGTLFLWVELVFRQIMLYMAVLFVPLGFAAYVWAPIRGWLVGLAEVITTVVFSKFIIAAVMSFGFLAIAQFQVDPTGPAIATFIGGLITVFVACFAAPGLIVFVMRPQHDQLSFSQVRAMTPIGADRSYASDQVGQMLGGLKGHLPGANKHVPKGPVGRT